MTIKIEFNNNNGIEAETLTFYDVQIAMMYAVLYFDSITKIEDENETYTAEEFLNKYEEA